MLAHEVARRQLEDWLFGNVRIEAPIELIERLDLTELGGLDAALQLAIGTHREFVVEDQFQELAMIEMIGDGLVQAHLQGRQQARQAKLLEQILQGIGHKRISRT